MGVTCLFIDNDWTVQKRIITFRDFDQSHTTNNIFILLKTIFREYEIVNKIFAIIFDNSTNNTTTILALTTLCKSLLVVNFFIKDALVIF